MTVAGLPECPNAQRWGASWSSCKRRSCPVCGPRWARNVATSMRVNFRAHPGAVVLVTITAPGEDRLPWDAVHCHHPRGGRCSGKRGCRVEQRAAREWSETLTWRWTKLRQAARLATIRACGEAPAILNRTWEPQKRGVPHAHLVLGAGTPAQLEAAACFVAAL